MTDELVKRLRAVDHMSLEDCFCQSSLYDEAANYIEQLTAERDEAWAYMSAAQGDLYDAVMIEAERDRLRDALTRLLEPYGDDPCYYDHHGYCQAHFVEADCCVAYARAALKGESHD